MCSPPSAVPSNFDLNNKNPFIIAGINSGIGKGKAIKSSLKFAFVISFREGKIFLRLLCVFSFCVNCLFFLLLPLLPFKTVLALISKDSFTFLFLMILVFFFCLPFFALTTREVRSHLLRFSPRMSRGGNEKSSMAKWE